MNKFKNYLIYAIKSIKAQQSSVKTIVMTLTISVTLIFCSISMGYAATQILRNTIDLDYENRKIEFYPIKKSDDPTELIRIPITDEMLLHIQSLDHVQNIVVNYSIYESVLSMELYGQKIYVPEALRAVDNRYATFPAYELDAILSENPEFKPIVWGRDFYPDDRLSVLVDEIVVRMLKIRDFNQLEDEKLVLTYIDPYDQVEKKIELTIVGAFARELGMFRHDNLTDEVIENADKGFDRIMGGTKPFIFTSDVVKILGVESNINHFSYKETGLNHIVISADSTHSVPELYATLEKEFNNKNLSNLVITQESLHAIQNTQRIILIIASLIILVGFINLLNHLILSSYERKKMIGLLKAMGYRNRDILQIIILENLMLAFKASIYSLIISYPFLFLVDVLLYSQYSQITNLSQGVFLPPIYFFLIISITLLVLTLIVTIIPARLLAKVDPITILKVGD